MYYVFVFGIFSNIDFSALLAWLDPPPSSQAAACAKPGSKLPLAEPMLPGRSSIICDSRFQGKQQNVVYNTALKRQGEPSRVCDHRASWAEKEQNAAVGAFLSGAA